MVRGHALRHPHGGSAGVISGHVEHPGLGLVHHREGLASLTFGKEVVRFKVAGKYIGSTYLIQVNQKTNNKSPKNKIK